MEHLLPAADALTDRLRAAGRLDWALADCADLLDPTLYRIDPETAIDRVKGARNLSGYARRAAVGLADWRERKALTSNRPRQWILRDAVLLDIAASAPSSKADIAAIRDLPASTARRHAGEFLAILDSARTTQDGYQPPGRPDEKQKAAMKAMQKKVASRAKELDIAAEVIAPRRELAAALQGDFSGRVFRGWRRELIGDELREMADA
ncbi:MAG: HRDC domain-containing protein [Woeseiaceae bacterium]|nr:HRDC domain-containing protein [Woeseiaceae bacterium]